MEQSQPDIGKKWWQGDWSLILFFALLNFFIHIFFLSGYGYFRDELYYIACSKNLAFGYVDHPPFAMFILAISRFIFGQSLFAIRIFALLANCSVVIMSGLLVRQLGGGRSAIVFSSLGVVFTPILMAMGSIYTMNAFDILFWITLAYLIVVMVNRNRLKLWLLFGLIAGIGLMNKYSLLFFGFGLVVGILCTKSRSLIFNRWFWIGGLITLVILSPHILWQLEYSFPTYEFMYNASHFKNVVLSPLEFFMEQVKNGGFVMFFLILTGLLYFLFDGEGKKYRFFGLMFFVIFGVMVFNKAKPYYFAPVFPLFLGAGSVYLEKLINKTKLKRILSAWVVLTLVAGGCFTAPFVMPVLGVESFISYQKTLGLQPRSDEKKAVGLLPQNYADMFGWEEFAARFAAVYKTLDPRDAQACTLLVTNYGQAGALEFFGARHGLPPVFCGHNNYWYWSRNHRPGKIMIVLGWGSSFEESRKSLERIYEIVEYRDKTDHKYIMPYENQRPIFLCRNPRVDLKAIWERFKNFN